MVPRVDFRWQDTGRGLGWHGMRMPLLIALAMVATLARLCRDTPAKRRSSSVMNRNRYLLALGLVVVLAYAAWWHRWQIVKEGPVAYRLDRWTGALTAVGVPRAAALKDGEWVPASPAMVGKIKVTKVRRTQPHEAKEGFLVSVYNGNQVPIRLGNFMAGDEANPREVMCDPEVWAPPLGEAECFLAMSDYVGLPEVFVKLSKALKDPE